MKTVIVCISDAYLERGKALMHFYESLSDETVILTPDFSHSYKKKTAYPQENIVTLPHKAYKKNLSYARLSGHAQFARTVRETMETLRPDRIHCLIPANSLAAQMGAYKKEHPETELIFDVNDLWPESLPAHGLQNSFVLSFWRNLRDRHLPQADLVICECRMFADHLARQAGNCPVVYWCGPPSSSGLQHFECLPVSPLRIAYLGSINNIIDIGLIRQILSLIAKERPVILELIGGGENKDAFLESVASCAEVHDHGMIFDETKKQEILQSCHFALNVMKEEVQVGLSLKSLDYLRNGLPLINTIQADTFEMVEKEQIGVNIDRKDPASGVKKILSYDREDILRMKKKARRIYDKLFTPDAFESRMFELLKKNELLMPGEAQAFETRRME